MPKIRGQGGKYVARSVDELAFVAAWNDRSISRLEIASRFGMAPSHLHRTATRLNLQPRGRPTDWAIPPVRQAAFRTDWLSNETASRIARKYRVSISTASATAARMGLPPKKRRRGTETVSGVERRGCMVCGGLCPPDAVGHPMCRGEWWAA